MPIPDPVEAGHLEITPEGQADPVRSWPFLDFAHFTATLDISVDGESFEEIL